MTTAYEGPWVLSRVLDDRAERLGDRVAVSADQGDLTFAELRERAARLAGALGALGLRPGDRVATMLDPCLEYVIAWFASGWAGTVEVPVNTEYKGLFLEHVLRSSGARALIVDARFVARMRGLELPDLEQVIVVGGAPPDAPLPVSSTTMQAALEHDAAVPHDAREDGLLYILYTSGTTGPSKGVMHSNRSALWTARVWQDMAQLGPDDVGYSVLPLFHVAARSAVLNACILGGARTALRARFSAEAFWSDVRRERATFFLYMGAIIHFLCLAPARDDDHDNPLRIAGGAAAPPKLADEFERRFGCQLIEVFGMTEIGTASGHAAGRRQPGTMGRPFAHLQIEVHDEDDARQPAGTPGEIVVRPAEPQAIFQGYWAEPEATVAAWRNLWFHSGDLGLITAEGELVFLDRLKDSMRRRGENISSFEVERSVQAHPAVFECAAYPIPSEATEDDVMVAVVPREGADLDVVELVAFCAETMPRFAVPRYVRVVLELPKTPTGRVQKHVLRDAGVVPGTFDRAAAGRRDAAEKGGSLRSRPNDW
jgi:crotonobetaine/carnitine-CoA ligase